MADVLFVCVEDCCLKRVLEDNGKLTILQTMCSSIQNIKRCGGVYANAIMPKVNVFKQYKILCGERMLSTLDAFALCVYNIKKKKNGLTVVLSQLVNSWQSDILCTVNLKHKFTLLTLFVV